MFSTAVNIANSNSAPPVTSMNGKGRRRGGGRERRAKCTYPTCSKSGHLISQCWVAHPELLPTNQDRTRAHRGRHQSDKKQVQRHDEPLKNLTEMTAALPLRDQSPPPFRFLDLAQVIQDQIYNHVYDEEYGISVCMYNSRKKTASQPAMSTIKRQNDGGVQKFLFYGSKESQLLLVSKKIRDDSRPARKRAFNGQMGLKWDYRGTGAAFNLICEDKWAALRARVTVLGVNGLKNATADGTPDGDVGLHATFWQNMPTLFPCVKIINLHYRSLDYKFRNRESYKQSWPFRAIIEPAYEIEFANGGKNEYFSQCAAHTTRASSLAGYMEEAGRECTIYLTSSMIWLNKSYRPVYWQISTFFFL